MLDCALALYQSDIIPRALPTDRSTVGVVITELAIALVLLVAMFLFRRRFLKILCACGAEVCLFLACKLFFGDESLLTQIMCWVTAAAACIVTVSIVNRINWSNMRGRPDR